MHVRSLCSLDRRCIGCVVLLTFDKRLHVDRRNQPYIMATALSKAAPKMAGGTSLPLPLVYSRPVLLSCFLRLPVLPAGLALNRRVFPTGSGIDARRLRGASGLILFEDYKLQLKRKLRATYLRYLLSQRHECQEQAS